ncbi:hypothetical protein [Motilimonas pumila]|uniref:Pilus assembly protein PilO n=1 Tax=Motilimonas pumila TaxID=2303987 RepID=A0A418YDY1_9GAMM|nr:hypothetical protein [Motilimonas pumila]RJG42731.1 hypothetical protein D1Z90_11615 [Motilimonas pumila]
MFEQLKQQFESSGYKEELEKPMVQWGGFVSALIIVWALLVQPILDWRQQTLDELAQAQLQRGKEASLLHSQAELQKALTHYQRWLTSSKEGYLKGRSEGAATSSLVVLLEKKFKPLDISFSSRRFVPAVVVPWVGEKIESRWVFKGPADKLIDFVHQVSGHAPEVLVIDKAEFRRTANNQFELSMNIYGFKAMAERDLIAQSRELEAER